MISTRISLVGLFLLAGCEARVGTDTERQQAPSPAGGKAEQGTLSIDAPGFDLKLNIPEAVRAEIGGDADIIYPGATLGGLHVAAEARPDSGSVEMRFTSPDPVDKVAAWYRDPARAADLKVASAERQGTATVIRGNTVDRGADGGAFLLRLAPANGGTEGVLTLRDGSA